MAKLPEIASFWMGRPLGWVEQMCLSSFQKMGHQVTLFQLGTVAGVPDGVNVCDMREIWTPDPDLIKKTGASYIADIFRLHLMTNTDMIWVDTDAYCLKPFQVNSDGYLIGHYHGRTEVANGVMRLPRTSAAVKFLLNSLVDPDFVPTWIRPAFQQRLRKLEHKQRIIEQFHLRRSVLGPKGLMFAVKQSGEIEQAMDEHVLYPLPWQYCDALFNPQGGVSGWVRNDTISMHFYSSQIRSIHHKKQPNPNSYAGKLLAQL